MSDDLFAMEDLKCVENIWLADMRSYEDPVLINDARILSNILTRQDEKFSSSCDNYFETVQTEIKPHMRKIVSDWILEVCEEQQCQAEVFHLAINYMDRFLSRVPLQKSQFQLLGCVCMFLASKFKETCPLPSENLVIYTDNSVSTNEITVRLGTKKCFNKTINIYLI
jgi:cyclin D2